MFAASQKSRCLSGPQRLPSQPRRTLPCAHTPTQDAHTPGLRAALAATSRFLPRSHLPHVSFLTRPPRGTRLLRTPTTHTQRVHARTPLSPPSLARSRASAHTRVGVSGGRIPRVREAPRTTLLAHVHPPAIPPCTPQRTHTHAPSPSLQAHLSGRQTDRQTPRFTNTPPRDPWSPCRAQAWARCRGGWQLSSRLASPVPGSLDFCLAMWLKAPFPLFFP